MTVPATGNLIDVYRPPDFDLVATPEAPHAITWRPEKNGPGTASFSIPMDDTAYGDIAVNDFVAIRPDGNTVAVLLVEMIAEHTLDAEGGARQVATYSGRLAGGQLEWALIAPALGDQAKPVEEDCILDWRSPRYDPVAYGDPWEASTEIMTVTAAITGWPTPAGEDFAQRFTDSTGAFMIWHSSGDETEAPEGTCLFYLDVTITNPGRHVLEVLMDNQGVVWVDGIQQLDIAETEGYHVAAFKRIELTADTHRLSFLTTNLGSGNPAALAFNLFKADHQDRPLEGVAVVAISDSSVQVLEYPDPFPGMTVGDDLLQFVAEARDGTKDAERDCFSWLVCNFDMDDDSNGDPWPRESITTKTQTTNLLQFLDELVAAGRVSRWFIDKDGVTLNVFAPGYSTRPTFSAPYTAGYELEPAPVNDPRSGQLVQLDRKIT